MTGYLVFNIKSKNLYEKLAGFGIKFRNAQYGEFNDGMETELPSGKAGVIDGSETCDEFPDVCEFASISEWLIHMILFTVGEDMSSDFSKELFSLSDDGDIEEAVIQDAYEFEGEFGPCNYIEIKNGKRMSVNYSNLDEIETAECDDVRFVVTGKLKIFENREEIVEYIEDMGGIVSGNISKNTDYLICNDIHSSSSKMEKAKALGIPVLSEAAFIRKFGDAGDFEDLLDEDELYEKAMDLFDEDISLLDFVVENGIQPIIMEVWKNGCWVSNS